MGNALPYRFDDLGWLQFDRLCAALLDLDSVAWEERDFGRVGVVPDGVVPPAGGARLAAPTLVVVAWLGPSGSRFRRRRLRRFLATELDRAPVAKVGSVLVLTNAQAPMDDVPVPLVRLGPERLGELVDADPQLRLRVPSVLGIRELGGLIAEEVGARSTADVAAAADLARVFVPTRAYAGALEVLKHRHFAVLTGPPEMGKTAIARMIGLAQMTTGWEAHECIRPEQLWDAFARDRPQVFVADDAFGSTEYRPDAAERWALELDRVLRAMDDRHWLIWTSRPAPLKAGLRRIHREHGLERFPQPAEVQVDAAALGADEKALILFRHAKSAALPRPAVDLVRACGWSIVSHPHFTPERIRRFVRERLVELASASTPEGELRAAVAAEIREPTEAMAASFSALAPEHRAVLVALLDAPPEPVPERELAAAVRRHSESGFSRTPAELLDRLTDHFVRLVPPTSVAWVHPSWRDLVIAELAEDATARRQFLECCGLEGILLALSVAGGVAGERALPLLYDDIDWDTLAARVGRLAPDLDDASVIRLLESLDAALDADLAGRARAEAGAVARLVLERLAAAWDDRHVTLSVATLEAWFAVASQLPEPPTAPELGRTWIELLPTEAVDLGSRAELVRFDEWLALAGVLGAFAPQELERFQFPRQQQDVFAAFVTDATTQRPDEAEELVTRILKRIRRVAPAYAPAAAHATATLALAAQDEPWFEVRFETHPRRPEPTPTDRTLVERVLRDLG
jgi:hypothetical protein